MAEADETANDRPAAPPAPAWSRYIMPIMIFLWIGFRMFGPEIQRFITEGTWPSGDEENVPAASVESPFELEQFLLTDSVVDGKPGSVKTNFSKSKDRRMILWSKWLAKGAAPDAEAPVPERIVEFVWIPPDGKPMSGKTSFTLLTPPEHGFIAVAEMQLGEFSPTGQWRVEPRTNNPNARNTPFVFTVGP